MITVIMMVDHEEKQVLPSGGRVRFCVIAVESPDTYQGSAQGRVVFPKTQCWNPSDNSVVSQRNGL